MTQTLANSKNRTPTRARGERVYKPGGKKEWRVVFWTHESTKPSRRQCSFSEAKYGKEAASLLSRAVLDYIDVKGVIPDDLHDPPILDPAKKELIEYYSALHESRKASMKKSRPRNGSIVGGTSGGDGIVKGSSDPTTVPLYTLTNSQSSPLSANSFSPIPGSLSTKSESPDELMQKHINRKERIHFDPSFISNSNMSTSPLSFASFSGAIKSPRTSNDVPSSSSSSSSILGAVTSEIESSVNMNSDAKNINNHSNDNITDGTQNLIQIPPIPRIFASREQNLQDLFVCGNVNMNGINASTFIPSIGSSIESAIPTPQKHGNCISIPNFGFGSSFLGIGVTTPSIAHPAGMFIPSTFPDAISSAAAIATSTLGVTNPDIRNLIGQNINQMAAIHGQQLQFCLLQQHLAGSYPTMPLLLQNCCPPIIGFDNHVTDSSSQKTMHSSIGNNVSIYSNKHTDGIFCNGSGIINTNNISTPNS
ncbi:hypothetical protein RS030_71128 [Cryptosporidium xiaoi]|uniref:AP2/ERF domain-containing protein n=1 Tax=Cryptosporidium xiaoi TaxID=659607 RepID=A0AAV9XUM7_9CRYT